MISPVDAETVRSSLKVLESRGKLSPGLVASADDGDSVAQLTLAVLHQRGVVKGADASKGATILQELNLDKNTKDIVDTIISEKGSQGKERLPKRSWIAHKAHKAAKKCIDYLGDNGEPIGELTISIPSNKPEKIAKWGIVLDKSAAKFAKDESLSEGNGNFNWVSFQFPDGSSDKSLEAFTSIIKQAHSIDLPKDHAVTVNGYIAALKDCTVTEINFRKFELMLTDEDVIRFAETCDKNCAVKQQIVLGHQHQITGKGIASLKANCTNAEIHFEYSSLSNSAQKMVRRLRM